MVRRLLPLVRQHGLRIVRVVGDGHRPKPSPLLTPPPRNPLSASPPLSPHHDHLQLLHLPSPDHHPDIRK